MTQDLPSVAKKSCLDDLLTTMGITREQLIGMTADDLFAAATRWQDAAYTTTAEAKVDRLFDSLQGRSVGLGRLN